MLSFEQSQLIDKYERLFAEPGWKEIIEDLADKREKIKDLLADTKTSYDQVMYERGRLEGYRYLQRIESLIAQIKEQANEPE